MCGIGKDVDVKETGKKLRRLMEENRYTPRTLSEKTQIAISTIYNHINGCNAPSHYHMGIYKEVLNATLDEMIVYKKENGNGI